MPMWGGRFEGGADPLFRALNDSLPFDCRLVQEDIKGSIAWAEGLAGAGVLKPDESAQLVEALRAIGAEATPERVRQGSEEDVHSWVEARLIERIGPLGKKLHTGRSRNDQVATDLRLWTRKALRVRIGEVRLAQGALLRLARRSEGAIMPGYTHLQRAQPVLFAHWALSHFEALERDARRLQEAHDGAGACPLGSGALAGAAYTLDRDAIARRLGFDRPTRNSLDAVADRDFALEAIAAAAMCMTHLSRLGEDLSLFNSGEFGFVQMGDATSSGSSLMPQKKNPDGAELLRGKTGRVLGDFVALATTIKGAPTAYNKDLQEDKEALFDAMDTLNVCLRLVVPMVDGLTLNEEAMRRAAIGGYSNATDLADELVASGVAFRDAHEIVGELVRLAIERGVGLEELPLDDITNRAPSLSGDVRNKLTLEASIARRDVPGGTAPGRVRQAIEEAERRLDAAAQEWQS